MNLDAYVIYNSSAVQTNTTMTDRCRRAQTFSRPFSVTEKSIFHHKTETFDQPTIELLLWTATAQLKDWSRFLLFVHLK